MAGENETKQQDSTKQGKFKAGLMIWAVLGVVVVSCSAAGLFLGRLLAASAKAPQSSSAVEQQPIEPPNEPQPTGQIDKNAKTWYYDLEPVVANLNEPSVTRYVRAIVTLEISPELDQKTGAALLEEKKPIITDWLTVYLSSLTLEDIRGDRNLRRIQSQILDAFNETLFPNSKPLIMNVLFKQFAVQ